MRQKIKNILRLVQEAKNKLPNDGTYDVNLNPIEYTKGYQVSFVRKEAFEKLNEVGWDIIANYLCDYLDSAVHIGCYCGDAEVSYHSLDEDKTYEIMEKFNQESVLNWYKKAMNPNNFKDWFIMNRLYNEEKIVNYDEIIREIQ